MDLRAFFEIEGIDVFSEVSISDLTKSDRESVVHYFPKARSVIVFGKEVPLQSYRLPPKHKTREMLRIAEGLDRSASRLAENLNSEQIPTLSVPLYLPVRIVDGRIQGMIRLKHIAAGGGLGSLGRNSVLLSPRYGPRLLLSGVVTSRQVSKNPFKNSGGPGTVSTDSRFCTGCGLCTRICPGGAIGPDGVDAFRCRTVSAWVPQPLVPAVKFLAGRKMLLRGLALLAPWIARTATIRCSLCVTECPQFNGEKKPDKSVFPELPAKKEGS